MIIINLINYMTIGAAKENEISIDTNNAKIEYNSGNTAITMVAANKLYPDPMPTIPLAHTSA